MNVSRRIKWAYLPLVVVCLAPFSVFAQDSAAITYEVLTEAVKPGMTAKFEQGVKAVDAYAQSHGDGTGTAAFEILTGPQNGNIVVLVPMKWADADKVQSYSAGLNQAAVQNVEPYLTSTQLSIIRTMPDLGNPGAAKAGPEKYYQVITLQIKPDKWDDFLAAVALISRAESKANPLPNPVIIYEHLYGGDPDQVTVAIGHPSLADLGKEGKSTSEVLRTIYGPEAAAPILKSLDSTIEGEEEEIIVYRPDLSFVPGGQGR